MPVCAGLAAAFSVVSAALLPGVPWVGLLSVGLAGVLPSPSPPLLVLPLRCLRVFRWGAGEMSAVPDSSIRSEMRSLIDWERLSLIHI